MVRSPDFIDLLLPVLPGLTVQRIEQTTTTLTLSLQTTAREACCPACQGRTSRVHSTYERALADLPWATYQVCLRIRVHRFRCSSKACPRRTFVEPLDPLALRRARRTARLVAQLTLVGQQLGGEAGSRLAHRLRTPVSPALLVQLVRQNPIPAHPTPRVLGIDDFAFKRGHTYGTLLCDLERGCVIDLLPDRTVETVTAWLQTHPGSTIISRDRAGAYAEAGRRGAPAAQQVADRFHLLKNLTETVERLLDRRRQRLPLRCPAPPAPAVPGSGGSPQAAQPTPVSAPAGQAPPTAAQQRRLERAITARQYAAQGWSLSAIARQLQLDRKTVRRFIRADDLPTGAPRRRRPSILNPYHAYLVQRWSAGCRNAQQLYREIRQQGYRGGASIVRAFLQHHRPDQADSSQHAAAARLAPRSGAWLLVAPPERLTAEQQAVRDRLRQAHPEFEHAYAFAQAFGTIVRQRHADTLTSWLTEAGASGIPEFRSFARGIQRDLSAVRAALTLNVSNGATEGHITRLKYIKRAMYGRAHFDLLRARVLAAA